MGAVNPFLERAGMTAYAAKMPARCVQLVEALSAVGIEKQEFINPQRVHQKLEESGGTESEFIELLERTRFVLSKLTERPVYYIWFNPELNLITS
jgi:hypothetical protein